MTALCSLQINTAAVQKETGEAKGKSGAQPGHKCLQISPQEQWHRNLTPDTGEDPESAGYTKQIQFLKNCSLTKQVLAHAEHKPTDTVHISARMFLYILINSFLKLSPGQNHDFFKIHGLGLTKIRGCFHNFINL